MTKTNKILIGLLLLQVVLIMGMRFGGESKLDYDRVAVLESFDPEAITQIEILGPPQKGDGPTQNSVTLAKKNGAWGIANADEFPVEKEKVSELLEALKGLTSRTRVLDSSVYHEKLEVADDTFLRKITLTGGGAPKVLYVGKSASFKNTHVRVDGQDAVYLVNDLSTSDIGDRAWHWVNRDYVKIPKAEVWSVNVTNPKGSMTLEKSAVDGQWAAVGLDAPLDTSVVDDLVRKATTVNMEVPVGKSVKPEHGLDSPIATVTLVTGTSTIAGTPPATTKDVTVKIGKKLDAENQYFVKSSESDYVVRVQAFAVTPLIEKTRADLVKKADEK